MGSPPGPTLGAALLAWWRLSRPEAWMVSLLPAYTGWLLASREIVPGFQLWAAFWHDAAASGATSAEFWHTVALWWQQAWPLVLAMAVMGPLLWTATILWNDVHDLEGDRRNPRKARSPLVQGVVSRGWAQRVGNAAALLAVAASVPLGVAFAALVAASLALAWLYSVPPVRLKTRPGADVAVNALGVGALSAIAGWSIVAPVGGFPWVFVPQGLLVAAAVYVPTTLVDHEADKASGYTTVATHLGPHRAYLMGWWSWVAANAGAILLAWQGLVIPRGMLPLLLLANPLMVGAYHAFIGRARSPEERVKGIVLCSFLFLMVNSWWALQYTGLWRA